MTRGCSVRRAVLGRGLETHRCIRLRRRAATGQRRSCRRLSGPRL